MKRALLIAAVLAVTIPPAPIASAQREVVVLPYSGPIGPAVADYFARGIAYAESRNAAAVIFEIDTPGGLDSSMREIIQREMNSRVPVIVFVAPRGARAASAGCLIVLGGDLAAMAPGTNIGAAHPIYASGGAVVDKIVNDSAAYARSLASAHKRNVDWAERAVRESISATSEEALSLGVIELTANDLTGLLAQLQGRMLHRPGGDVKLDPAGAQVTTIEMDTREKLFSALTHPTITYLLMLLGVLAIIIEIVTPHGYVTGTIGALAVLLAMVGLVGLPVQITGAAILVAGMVLLGLELKITSHGLLTLLGMAGFVAGSILLLPRIPGYSISGYAIGTVTVLWAVMLGAVVRLVVRARHAPILTGTQLVVGAAGVAKTDIAPKGVVLVNGEEWHAVADASPIARGTGITVVSVEGLKLHVRKTA